jgi:hypothetical protein
MSTSCCVQRLYHPFLTFVAGAILLVPLLRAQEGAAQPADPFASVALGKGITVFIVISPNCPACLEQMAFYKQLLNLPRMDGKDGKLIVLAQQGVIPVGKVLDDQGLKPHLLTSGPAETHEIRDLPSLFNGNASCDSQDNKYHVTCNSGGSCTCGDWGDNCVRDP